MTTMGKIGWRKICVRPVFQPEAKGRKVDNITSSSESLVWVIKNNISGKPDWTIFLMEYIKPKEECFIRCPNTWFEKTRRSRILLSNFVVLGYRMTETLSQVFHTASQSINSSQRYSERKLTESYDN